MVFTTFLFIFMLATAPCTLASAPVISFQCRHWRALKANPLTQYLIKEILLIKSYFYSSLTWWKGVYLLSRLCLSGAPLPVTARADEQSHFWLERWDSNPHSQGQSLDSCGFRDRLLTIRILSIAGWRRGWDSNPRTLAGLRFSRPVHSTRLCDPSI